MPTRPAQPEPAGSAPTFKGVAVRQGRAGFIVAESTSTRPRRPSSHLQRCSSLVAHQTLSFPGGIVEESSWRRRRPRSAAPRRSSGRRDAAPAHQGFMQTHWFERHHEAGTSRGRGHELAHCSESQRAGDRSCREREHMHLARSCLSVLDRDVLLIIREAEIAEGDGLDHDRCRRRRAARVLCPSAETKPPEAAPP